MPRLGPLYTALLWSNRSAVCAGERYIQGARAIALASWVLHLRHTSDFLSVLTANRSILSPNTIFAALQNVFRPLVHHPCSSQALQRSWSCNMDFYEQFHLSQGHLVCSSRLCQTKRKSVRRVSCVARGTDDLVLTEYGCVLRVSSEAL